MKFSSRLGVCELLTVIAKGQQFNNYVCVISNINLLSLQEVKELDLLTSYSKQFQQILQEEYWKLENL